MGVFRQFPYSNFHEMNLDEMIKIIKNMLEEWAQYHAEWDAWMDEINDDWSNYQEVMNEAWQNMQNFINNYFDNLDVQEEINNKITSMVRTGEFNRIVEPYVPPTVTAWLATHITQPEGVVIDTSLTVEGACADAKATGDAIGELDTAITALEMLPPKVDNPHYTYKNDFVIGSTAGLNNQDPTRAKTKPLYGQGTITIKNASSAGYLFGLDYWDGEPYNSTKHESGYQNSDSYSQTLDGKWYVVVVVNKADPTTNINLASLNASSIAIIEELTTSDGIILGIEQKLSTLEHTQNLFDYSTIANGYFLRYDTGNIQIVTDWSTSDFIPVAGLTKFATGYAKHFAFYDAYKTFILGSGFEVADAGGNVINVPDGAYYVRFDWYEPKLALYGFTEETMQVIPNALNIDSSFHSYNTPYNYGFSGETKHLDYWAGKRILWLGSSIPEGNHRPPYGYPDILGEKLGCTVINNSVGGSMAMSGRQMLVSESDPYGLAGQNWGWTKGFTQPLSLKNDFITNWDTWKTEFTDAPETLDTTTQDMILASSYENALDPYLLDSNKCDLYVLNFGWNDSTPELYSRDSNNKPYCDWTYQYKDDNAPDINTVDPYRYNTRTFRGAINWIIRRILEAQPQAYILILGEGEYAKYNQLVNAQEKCAYENACQYIPLWKVMGLNQRKITTTKRADSKGWWTEVSFEGPVQYCRIYDGTHPQGWMTTKIAEYLEAQFRFNIRA